MVGTAISQDAQPYEDSDAYQIYSLLLPREEAYGFAEDILMIQENAVAPDITGACVRPADADRFRAAIADYNRVREKTWRLQRRFQIPKIYITVGNGVISALPDHPPSVVSYVRMSPVGFNRDKTQAVVFMESSCGRLCGSSRLHFLEKVRGKWKDADVSTCAGTS